MKIKNFKKSVSYNFGDIKPGTVFAIDGNFYMAIESIEEMNLVCRSMRSISKPES